MRRHQRSPLAYQIEMIAGRVGDEREHPQADVVPEPSPPLDETEAAPLTDLDDTKGG